MKSLSRRCFCVTTLFAPVFVSGRELSARVTSAPPSATTDDLPVETLYGIGTRMLKEGRTFEKAAAHLARALEKDPSSADYALALGCAYASRAASLAWAGGFAGRLAGETAAYQKAIKELPQQEAEMRQGLKDRNAGEAEVKEFERSLDAYKQRLKLPPISAIHIKDDKAPYDLTQPELVAKLTELNQKALATWDNGVALSKTPEEKARALTVRGWGMRVLRFYLSDDSPWRLHLVSETPRPSQSGYRYKAVPLEIKGLPTDAQTNTALEEATKNAPEIALYWQARADFLAFKEQEKRDAEITDLYRRAASLDPKNANLWVLVYDRETAYQYGEKQTDAPRAVDDLRRAQARDTSNAWYGYEQAGCELINGFWNRSDTLSETATEKQKQAARDAPRTNAGYAAGKRAVAAIERANALSRFAPPVYRDSVPDLLARVWRYAPPYWRGDVYVASAGRFQNMAWLVVRYAQSLSADKKNDVEAVRVFRVLLQAGVRVMGAWPPFEGTDMANEENNSRALFAVSGLTLGSSAYRGLLQIVTKERDPDAHAALIRESEAWEKRFQDWLSSLPQEGTPLMYSVYERN